MCLVFSWIGVHAASPFRQAARLRAANDTLDRQIHQYQLQRQQNEKEVKSLETHDGIVYAARKLGWTMPGEIKLHLPPSK